MENIRITTKQFIGMVALTLTAGWGLALLCIAMCSKVFTYNNIQGDPIASIIVNGVISLCFLGSLELSSRLYRKQSFFGEALFPIQKRSWIVGFGLWSTFMVFCYGVGLGLGFISLSNTFNNRYFWQFAVCAIPVILVQVLFEELFFRGLILRFLSQLRIQKWLALAIAAVVFGLFHLGNTENSFGIWFLAVVIGNGLIWGIWFLATKNIYMSFGAHVANNLFGLLVVSYSGSSVVSESIFFTTFSLPFLVMFTLLTWALVIYYFTKNKMLPKK